MRCTQLEWLCSNLPSLEEANFSSNSFVFYLVFYFIFGYFLLLVYFFSFAIKTVSRPSLFQTRENNFPLFSVASRLGFLLHYIKKYK